MQLFLAGHTNASKEDRSRNSSTPNAKRQKTAADSNSNQNASPGLSTNKRNSLTKDTSKTPTNPSVCSNTPKPQRQNTAPTTSNGGSTPRQTNVSRVTGSPSTSHQKQLSDLPVPASFLKPLPPDEACVDSLPLSFLLTKVRGIESQYNNRFAMHIKGNCNFFLFAYTRDSCTGFIMFILRYVFFFRNIIAPHGKS